MIHNFSKCVSLLFSLSIATLSTSAKEQYKPKYFVVGGSLEDSYDIAKYAVSIQLDLPDHLFGVGHICGGSIIAKNKILTAAHCLITEEEVRSVEVLVVVVGIRDRFERTNFTQVHEVAKLVPHKDYSKQEHIINDIGIVILKDEIQFNTPEIAKIKLAVSRPRRNQICTVVGWGRMYSEGPTSAEVQFAEVKILGRGECYSRLNGAIHSAGQMCVGDAPDWRAGSCQGDSGGPLICNSKLAGIVSAGIGCAEKYMPAVYTDVHYYRDWINFGGLKTCQCHCVAVVFLIHFVT